MDGRAVSLVGVLVTFPVTATTGLDEAAALAVLGLVAAGGLMVASLEVVGVAVLEAVADAASL